MLSSGGLGAVPNTLTTVSRDFEVASNWQNNVQVERAAERSLRGLGRRVVLARLQPAARQQHQRHQPDWPLADGRPVYSTAVNATTRLDPRYNVINQIESLGESTYKNLTAQLTGRNLKGIQFDFAYTLGKAEDNAPITSVLSVTGDAGRTNPESLDFDKGPNVLDQRHTFAGSIVARPSIDGGNAFTRGLVNGTIVGVAMQFANGIPVDLRANPGEINNDGVNSDRPAGISRNSLRLPARYNVDLRLSRQVAVGGPRRVEVIAEVKNLFNTVQWSSVTGTAIAVDRLTGLPTGTVPTSGDQLIPTGGYEQRQLQFGFKFVF